ncbi:bifunctional diaminohydroxyphosphoribosylaminopyrimidine deaminase/5-amino-6-(5-phosphoribosylamino)uracil reductase RibD [Ottowia pentelensis]|uniref:Riboflavin biosynthesis protein RibD n=1 Tax=Ottowia pentelensis TaxID=511108 RepID=A0ABV6PUN1_9BURK|nr:bifunctional diaminohydroxyphosphoribosylaminopyrimidine deaminase/5-amino-6-(5-phosphoribosylamino)uracil reductase RibD [Ottowia sp.]
MSQALALAEQARLICPPNPAVGCVLVGADGQVIGQGHTQPTGQAHAEVMALRDAQARGHATAGATAYVTLEPCAHQGRTGPCADALIEAGVRKVVASLQDPNPRVAGQGLARLQAAGVEVEVGPGAEVARELNIGFFSRMTRGRPWVRMKVAASLDGRTALPNGASQWITSDAARADGHAWRARACAVLTGIGTVLRDDPRLDVRLPSATRQPMLVIADSQWRTPLAARLWQVPGRRVCIVGASADAGREQALRERGADVLQQPAAEGRIDLSALLVELARREVNEVHVEAGAQLNAALWRAGLVDELLLYQAPRLLGEGAPLAALGPFAELAQGPQLEYIGVDRIGPDLRIRARVTGR